MNKLLDVDFIIQKDNRTIVLDIKHMDESLRKCDNNILAKTNDNKYTIISNCYPTVGYNKLLLRGRYENRDNEFAYYTFNSTEEMNEYIKNMNKLIDEINNPIIEIDINEDLIEDMYKKYTIKNYIIEIIQDVDYNYIKIMIAENGVLKSGVKFWYISDNKFIGQPFDEVVEEFDNFCKRRNINAKLVR